MPLTQERIGQRSILGEAHNAVFSPGFLVLSHPGRVTAKNQRQGSQGVDNGEKQNTLHSH